MSATTSLNRIGATLHVTLEPCCHWGKTLPCVDAGPRPVRGWARLREAGIAMTIGEGSAEAAAIMSGFLLRTLTGAPELILLPRAARSVPLGADALLRTRNDNPELLLSVHTATIPATDLRPDARLLRRSGAAGRDAASAIASWYILGSWSQDLIE